MNSLREILTQVQAIIRLQLRNLSLSAVIKELMVSSAPEASYFLAQVMRVAGGQPELGPGEVELTLGQHFKAVTQVTTFTIVYPFVKRTPRAAMQWKDEFLRERREGMFERFNTWLTSHSPAEVIFQSLLQILVCELPAILKTERIDPVASEFQAYLVWLSFFEVKEREEHLAVCQAVKVIKDARLANTPDYQHRGHLMLRRVVDLLGCEQRQNGSLHMLFDPLSIRQKDIEYFCNVYDYLFLELDEKYLCNIFKALTHSGINRQILFLVSMVSHLLQNGEQFYTLRYLYQHFILPILACQYKTHRKLYREVYEVVLFYVAGFLAHCRLDKTAIDCLLEHVEAGREEWAELAILACKDDLELKENTKKRITGLKIESISIDRLSKSIEEKKSVWKVTMRNGRKLKKYPEIDSVRFKGITNDTNDCYIISSIQALFVTEELPSLIDSLKGSQKKGKMPLFDELRRSFDSLKRRQDKQQVKGVKENGPDVFRSSRNQQDVHQYLLQLFNQLQQQLTLTPSGLSQFQKIFKIDTACKFSCDTCGNIWKKQQIEYTYIHSFSHNQSFDFQSKLGRVEGYSCPKCKAKTASQQTTIVSQPLVLMLHINRFAHQEGVGHKKLGNKPIRRHIGKYELAGFISHRGAKISAGHYIFYGKVEKGRWAVFDDRRVAEFSVEQGQEFQRQFRSENTPYILFYRLGEA